MESACWSQPAGAPKGLCFLFPEPVCKSDFPFYHSRETTHIAVPLRDRFYFPGICDFDWLAAGSERGLIFIFGHRFTRHPDVDRFKLGHHPPSR